MQSALNIKYYRVIIAYLKPAIKSIKFIKKLKKVK